MHSTPNINLLPKKSIGRRLFRQSGLLLILGSIVMIAYPFLGVLEYAVAKNDYHISALQFNQAVGINSGFNQIPDTEIIQQLEPEAREELIAQNPEPVTQPVVVPSENLSPQPTIAPEQPVQPIPEPVPTPPVPIVSPNKVSIPKIGVEMEITEGNDAESALAGGAWRIPGTSNPSQGGNTVLGGHRYLYRPPSKRTFFNLDKVAIGDTVNVTWDGQNYTYQVREIKEVQPDQIDVLNNTHTSQLTLFTCTPVFTSDRRLIIVADLI